MSHGPKRFLYVQISGLDVTSARIPWDPHGLQPTSLFSTGRGLPGLNRPKERGSLFFFDLESWDSVWEFHSSPSPPRQKDKKQNREQRDLRKQPKKGTLQQGTLQKHTYTTIAAMSFASTKQLGGDGTLEDTPNVGQVN